MVDDNSVILSSSKLNSSGARLAKGPARAAVNGLCAGTEGEILTAFPRVPGDMRRVFQAYADGRRDSTGPNNPPPTP